MMQTDISAACFWITHPYNYVRNNRAAGGDFYGFWYEVHAHPHGPSATNSVCPMGNRVGAFENNLAHSMGRYGLRIMEVIARKFPCAEVRNPTEVDPWLDNPSF